MISSILKLIYAVLFTYLLAKFLRWLVNYLYQLNNYKNLKGFSILPFLGNTHQLGKRDEFLKKMIVMSKTFKNEPIFRFWRGWNPVVIFHKADHLDLMMSGSKNNQKSFEYDFLRPWLAEGLLTSYGDKWTVRRRLLTPTFHFDILNDFLHVFNEQSDILIEILSNLSKSDENIDIYERLGYCALDVICQTAMGKHGSTQIDGHNSTYYKAVAKMVVVVRERMFTPWYWPDIIFNNFTQSGKEHREALKILHSFTEKIIMERNDELLASNYMISDKKVAFLDMLLKVKHEDPTITFADIQEEVDTFMFEGHDTTAAAMSFACHLIGSNPDVQKKLQQEVDQVIGSVNRQITNEDLKNLKYLECVIKETLRLFPSVPVHSRVFSQIDKIGDQKILKGTTGAIFTYMIHRDEKYYPDPEKFDPDRFLPENCKDRHPFAYIPFSAGRRNCIGQRFAIMEEKVVLCKILRKFEIKACLTTEQLEPIADVILRPLNGIPIRLSLRNKFYF